MKKYIYFLSIALIINGFVPLNAQEILLQWTGVVRNDLLDPIPFAHILIKKTYRGTVSDDNGRFTLITHPGDTLLVSCIGFKLGKIPVPKITNTAPKHYVKDIILETDTIKLSEVVIFPWKTYREFKDAFIALDLPEDDLQRAYHNIAVIQEQIYSAIANRPASPTSNFRDVMTARHNRAMNYGHMYPTYMITNPLAWANFFKALRDGQFKKKDNSHSREQYPNQVEDYIKNNPEQ